MRHLIRTIIIQSLYEWDFYNREKDLLEIVDRHLKDVSQDIDEPEFLWRLIKGVVEHLPKIDNIIEKAAPDWPIAQIGLIDRNVLRLGIYELLFSDKNEVPPKVAINEAIEIAKNYGGENSPKFVNGVLGTIYRELGGGDTEESIKKAESLPQGAAIERLVGAVIFRQEGKKIYWAMVKDMFNKWTFVKGHKEFGESRQEAVLREMREEVGIEGKVISSIGQNDYPATTEEGKPVIRKVVYFLIETSNRNLVLEKNFGLVETAWILQEEVRQKTHYSDLDNIIDVSAQKISEIVSRKENAV